MQSLGYKPRKGQVFKCAICGKDINCKPSHIGKAKFCSYKCKNKYQSRRKRSLVCLVCGTKFTRPPSQAAKKKNRFCGRACKKAYRKLKPDHKTLDQQWSKLVKMIARYKCEYCGIANVPLNSHHIFSRTSKATRWRVDNGICLCTEHHLLGNVSAHKSPMIFAEWIKEKRGETWYDTLKAMWHRTDPVNLDEVRMYLSELERGVREDNNEYYDHTNA